MFENKKVLVTGGSGHIGAAICRAFAGYGAEVHFTYHHNREKAEQLATAIGATAIELNLAMVADIQSTLAPLASKVGGFDVLVNNAAIAQILPLSMLDEADVDAVLAVNFKGTLFVTKAIIKGMIRNRRGSIVNMGSIAGHRLMDVPITYAMTKAAMSGLTLALATEVRKFGIRVNCVVPGMIEGGVSSGVPDDLRDDYKRHCASDRIGTAAEVAELVCFVASDKASYINGQNLHINGGI